MNPGKPTKDYTFIIEYRGDATGPKRQVFFHIVYQEVPQPGHPRSGNTNTAKEYGYLSGEIQSSSGYVRVRVGQDETRVDYVRTYLPAAESQFKRNGDVSYSYLVNDASVSR